MSVVQPHRFHVFVSYRRAGAAAHAGRLYDFLTRGVDDQPGFADDQIFMDISKVKPGEDFRTAIHDAVMRSDLLLALIGPEWSSVQDALGRRRLDDPADYVRLELEAALARDIPVIPLLVGGATMPTEAELPPSLAPLAYRHAVDLSETRWSYDVGRLIESLKERELDVDPQARRQAAGPRETRAEDVTVGGAVHATGGSIGVIGSVGGDVKLPRPADGD